uniref:DUF5745 domain-containing protein n=2 Tax=Macrostomum lignano TaxID=282301 RepID=A0A1I8JFP0_9PLAT
FQEDHDSFLTAGGSGFGGHVAMATDLLRRLPGRQQQQQLRSLDDLGDVVEFFSEVFALTCPEAATSVLDEGGGADGLDKLRGIIDSLADDVIGVSLSHIRPEDVLARDRTAVGNLVEIFHGLAEFAPDLEAAAEPPRTSAIEAAVDARPPPRAAADEFRPATPPRPSENSKRQQTAAAAAHIDYDSPALEMPPSLRRSYEQLHRLADRTLRLSREAVTAPAPAASRLEDDSEDSDAGDKFQRGQQLRWRRASEGAEFRNDNTESDEAPDDAASASDGGDSGVGGGGGEGGGRGGLCCGLPATSPRARLAGYAEEHAVRVEEERLRLRRLQRERQLRLAAEAGGRADGRDTAAAAETAMLTERRRQLEAAYRQSERQLRDEVGGGRGRGGGLIKSRARQCPIKQAKQQRQRRPAAHGDPQLLPELLSEFPFLDVSEATLRQMRDRLDRHSRHMAATAASASRGAGGRGNKAAAVVTDAERRQRLLVESLRREAAAAERQREQSERRAAAIRVRALDRERRSESAKARQYYDQFVARQRARMLAKRSVEEQVFRRLFTEALQLQRQRIREHRTRARDHQAELHKRTADEVASMENFYRDRFAMLAESLATERRELQVRERAHDHLVRGLSRDLRRRMETEVRDIQEQLARDQDDAHFRQLDADQVLARLYSRMAEPPRLHAV